MTIRLPSDLEALVEKRVASGAYSSAEEVVRRALEVLDSEETWSEDERRALDHKIARALEQVATGSVLGPEEARRRLAAMRERHLAERR